MAAGGVHRTAGAGGAPAHGPAPSPRHLPRRPPGAPPDASGGAARCALVPRRLRARLPPHRRGRAVAHAAGVLRVLGAGRARAGPRRAAAAARRARRGAAGRAVRVLAPYAAGPDLPVGGAGAASGGGDLLAVAAVRVPVADPDGAADAGPRVGRGHDPGAAGGGRPGDLPRGDNVPGALPAAILGAVRGAHGRGGAGGDGEPDEHVPRHDGEGVEGDGPILLLHEPEPGLRGHLPQQAPDGAHLRRRQDQPRGGQLHPEAHRRHAVLRVHQPHQEGQVPGARGQRRRGGTQKLASSVC
jgi:hypothetical protein